MLKKYSLVLSSLLMACLVSGQAFAQSAGTAADSGAASMSYSSQISSVQGQKTSFGIGQAKAPRRIGAPRSHEVVEGDTLWDISSSYLEDPMQWPALWSYNPQITNPHWIYPGDTVYLEPGSDNTSVVPVQEEAAPGFVPTKLTGRGTIVVPGYYLTELPETRGHVLYSDQEKHLLAPGDEIQVDFVNEDTRKKVYGGQRFTIFEQSTPVLNEDGDPMAYKLIRVGAMELVEHHTDTLSTARITQATREIERGNLVIPDADLTFSVKRVPNSKSMEGRIIDTIDIVSHIGAEQFIIINRGTEDGVVPGNRWIIFEQREGLDILPQGEGANTQYADDNNKKKKDDDDKDMRDGEIERPDERYWVLGHAPQTPQWPPRRDELDDIYGDREYTTDDLPLRKIGEVLTVDSQDKFCTAIVTSSSREVGIDTRVVLIKGF